MVDLSFPYEQTFAVSLYYKSFYLLLQIVAVGCVVSVITMEPVIFIPWPLIGISLQLAGER